LNYTIKILHAIYGFLLVLFVNSLEYTWIETLAASSLFFIFIIDNIFIRKIIIIPKLIYPFIFFIIISFLGLIVNQSDSSLPSIILLIKLLIFVIVIYNQVIKINNFNFIFYGITAALLVNIYIGYFISDDFFMLTTKRYSGSLMNPNHYSFLLSSTIAFFLYLIFSFNKKIKINSIIKFIITLLILIFSYEIIFKTSSRQGVLIVIICFLFYIYKSFKNLNVFRALVTLLISIFIIDIALSSLSNSIYIEERVFSIFSFDKDIDASVNQRYYYIVKAFKYWIENPIFGIGLDQFRVLNNSSYSHNNYIELLATTGLLGFIFYYLPHFLLLKKYFLSKKNKSNLEYSIFFLIIVLISDISSVNYSEKPFWLMFTVVIFLSSTFNIQKSNTIFKL
jgi:O-antigen ligase